MLTSRSNSKIKYIESLRKGKERKKENCFLIEGEREVSRAGKLKTIVYHEKTSFIETYEKQGVELIHVSKALLEKISLRGEILAIAKRVDKSLSSLKGKFFVALVGIEKPGNIGAILRTCDGAGVDGVLIVDPLVDHLHPNAIRTSLGASFSLDIVTCTTKEAFSFIKKEGLTLYTTSPAAEKSASTVSYNFPLLIAFGQEDKGLPNQWLQGVKISIPMKGVCDSLNVSVSAGIVLYEVLQQNEC